MSRPSKVARTKVEVSDVAEQVEVEDKKVAEMRKYKDDYFGKLEAVVTSRGANCAAIIIDVEREEEDDWCVRKEDPNELYTKEQVDSLRHILVNRSRQEFINKAYTMVSRGEGSTEDGNVVIRKLVPWVNRAKKQTTNALRFDALFGLTYSLLEEDMWMCDNELYGPGKELEKGVLALGMAWADLLPLSDEELDIDPEFTRPGVVALLEKFKKEVEGCDSYEKCKPIMWTK